MLKRIWSVLLGICMTFSGIACLITGIVIVVQVFARLFAGTAFTFVEEVAQLAVIMTVFLGLGEAERTNQHLTLEIVFSVFPKAKFYLMMLGKLIMGVYAGIICYSAWLMLPSAQRITTPASHFPVRFVYYAMIFGSALWLIQSILNMAVLVQERRKEV